MFVVSRLEHSSFAAVASVRGFAKAAAKAAPKKVKIRLSVNKKKEGGGGKFFPESVDRSKMDRKGELLSECLAPRTDVVDERTVEDLAINEILAKEYSRLKMREHHAISGQISKMIKAKYSAIAELPPRLQLETLRRADYPFPINRFVFVALEPEPSSPPLVCSHDFGVCNCNVLTQIYLHGYSTHPGIPRVHKGRFSLAPSPPPSSASPSHIDLTGKFIPAHPVFAIPVGILSQYPFQSVLSRRNVR